MDGRWFTVIVLIVLPAVLVGVTVEWFAANPLALLAEFGAIIAGSLYLLTYTDAFAAG
jgi:hypothetical protein